MKQLKGDLLWGSILLLWLLMLIVPSAREVFLKTTEAHPYMGGFVKFTVLATMGDMLGGRILRGKWQFQQGFILKAINWGVMGMMITLVFTVFFAGTAAAQGAGRLPFEGSTIAHALFASVIMNMTFGPMLYVYHKCLDLLIDIGIEKQKGIQMRQKLVPEMVSRIDWQAMVGFSWLTTCIFVWMPCHTIVFLLPGEYRVLASAFLSILLGILVALSKKKSQK